MDVFLEIGAFVLATMLQCDGFCSAVLKDLYEKGSQSKKWPFLWTTLPRYGLLKFK